MTDFKGLKIFILSLMLCLMYIGNANAETTRLIVDQSRLLTFSNVERVAVANPAIADVLVLSSSEVLLVGKSAGITTVQVWVNSSCYTYSIEVAENDQAIANEIKNIIEHDGVVVKKVKNTIILSGKVDDQLQKKRAETIAAGFADKVVNLLEASKPIQIKLEARIVEINRDKIDKLGVKWGNDPGNTPGSFVVGQTVINSRETKNFNYAPIDPHLSFVIQSGNAKLLSQPNLITVSGTKANILIGGQIPVPVSFENGKVSIEWKDYGIKLDVLPDITGEKLINSKVVAEVSSLDWNSPYKIEIAGGLNLPPLKTRHAETNIVMSSGQTMAIGGLIATTDSKDVMKIPFLGDLPLIGKLFRSSSFTRGETELIIFITPTIVDPAEYTPSMTTQMQSVIAEEPWGGSKNANPVKP